MTERGVAEVRTEVCVPALRHVAGGRDPVDIAVEHVLFEGIAPWPAPRWCGRRRRPAPT